jgi:hypothetical protein
MAEVTIGGDLLILPIVEAGCWFGRGGEAAPRRLASDQELAGRDDLLTLIRSGEDFGLAAGFPTGLHLGGPIATALSSASITNVRLPVRMNASDGTSSAGCALSPNDTVANMPGRSRPPRLGQFNPHGQRPRSPPVLSGRIAETRPDEGLAGKCRERHPRTMMPGPERSGRSPRARRR